MEESGSGVAAGRLLSSSGIERRRFLQLMSASWGLRPAVFGAEAGATAKLSPAAGPELVSVTGALTAEAAGTILPHEHVMSLFGAEPTEVPQYDGESLLGTVVPYLSSLKALGLGTVADCTTAFFGRDPGLLKVISEASGVKILTNTGYYAAAGDRYVPPHSYRESAEQTAARWIKEWEEGIGETAIRPGFVKTGVDDGPLSEIDAKMVRAAAITHRETGLTIACHTGNNPDSVAAQLEILKEEGVSPSAWIWVHAHSVEDPENLLPAAGQGAWIELDGVSAENAESHASLLEFLRKRGHSDQILLSHDGNSFRYGGRPAKPYEGLFTVFIPLLESRGFEPEEIRNLVAVNPFRALSPRIRNR